MVAERIAKLGFKRWYERTLVESHIFLVTALLGAVVALTGVEMVGQRDGDGMRLALGIAAVLIGGVIAGSSVSRYVRMLMTAINLGERATCPGCHTYGKFDVLASGQIRAKAQGQSGSLWIRVKCSKCGDVWRVE